MKTKWENRLDGGVVVANPIPIEFELPKEKVDQHISEALEQAQKLGIKGKDVSPFLLAKVKELTKGESLKANIQLVYNNASLAAKIAVAFSKL